MRLWFTALLLGLGLSVAGCNAPGYGTKGGSKSANDKPAGKKGGEEQKKGGDDAAPPPDLPDYAPLE